MTGALVILAVTVAVGILLRLTHRPDTSAAPQAPAPAPAAADGECCGLHAVCEKQAAAADGPDYFDDEELDRFAGRDAATYTPEETDEFRAVLYTLIPSDVFAWGASLTRRRISLPDPLRDEWIMLCEDAATQQRHHS